MTDVELDNSAQLEQRVRELEAENARPVADFGVAGSDAARGRRRGRWWRALLSAVCIVLAVVVLPVPSSRLGPVSSSSTRASS